MQNSTFKKLVHISEEAYPPVHVPLIFGQDCFIFTQQDVRKIEDSRLFSVSILLPNGNLKPLNPLDPDCLLEILKLKNLLDSKSYFNCQNLFDFLNLKTYGGLFVQQQQQPYSQPSYQPHPQSCQTIPQPMEISYSNQVASIEQQLNWDRFNNTSAPFPMTYSQGTSSTEIVGSCREIQQNKQTCCNCCCSCTNCKNKNITKVVTFSKATYTPNIERYSDKATKKLGAREQVKQKKLNDPFTYIS